MKVCPLCGDVVDSLIESWAVVRDKDGNDHDVHAQCARGLPSVEEEVR